MLIEKTKFGAFLGALVVLSSACIIVDSDDIDDDADGNEGGTTNDGGSTANFGGEGGTGAEGGLGGEGGAGGGEPTCLDDIGAPDECLSSTACEGFSNCGGVDLGYFKAGVEEELVFCLNGLNPASCSFIDDVLNTCTFDALSSACVDTAGEPFCSEIAVACAVVDDEAWQNECGPYMDGLTDDGRAAFTDCQVLACDEGGTVDDMATCLAALYP